MLLAAALLLFGLLFQQLVTLLIAILITVLLAIPLSALRDPARALQGARARSAPWSGLLIGVGIFVGVLALIIPSFADQAQEFVDEVPAIVDDVEETVADITGSQPSEVGSGGPGVPPALHRRPRASSSARWHRSG